MWPNKDAKINRPLWRSGVFQKFAFRLTTNGPIVALTFNLGARAALRKEVQCHESGVGLVHRSQGLVHQLHLLQGRQSCHRSRSKLLVWASVRKKAWTEFWFVTIANKALHRMSMVGVGPPLMPSQDVSIHVQVHASPHHSSAEDATVDLYYFLLENFLLQWQFWRRSKWRTINTGA